MSDVAQRLRQVTEEDAYARPWTFGQLCIEAALEIERLRSAVARDILPPNTAVHDSTEGKGIDTHAD